MAKKQSKEQVRETRVKRTADADEKRAAADAPVRRARQIRNDHMKDEIKKSRERLVDRFAAQEDEDEKGFETDDKGKVKGGGKKSLTLHDGKPGSGAGLKPGDWHAPASNPGAAARVPSQPLQPESLQSHGKGILYDKDLDNPPYDSGDPALVDEGPSGSGSPSNAHAHSRSIDKAAERKKAEKATPRSKQADPDNPAIGRGGKKDATASPNPIGSRHASKNAVAGGSNSGIDE
jgi:hypothetical protein